MTQQKEENWKELRILCLDNEKGVENTDHEKDSSDSSAWFVALYGDSLQQKSGSTKR